MPRKRMIDPEFWSDEEIGQWSIEARLFYIGLWNFADDEGRLKAHPKLLKAQIFPYDEKINVEKLMQEVSKKVLWYKINNQQYGWIKNFTKHQTINRPSKSKLPPPPEDVKNQFIEASVNIHEHFNEDSRLNKKEKKKNIKENNNIYTILEHWNSKNIKNLDFKKETKVREKTIKKLRVWLKDYSSDEIIEAINNYAFIISNPDKFFFTYKWQLWEFLDRGLVNFLTKNKPFENFRKDRREKASQIGKTQKKPKIIEQLEREFNEKIKPKIIKEILKKQSEDELNFEELCRLDETQKNYIRQKLKQHKGFKCDLSELKTI
jgi:hypothetical protein